jgi:hypothetical protein
MVSHLSCFQTLIEPIFMFCMKVVNELTRMSNVTPGIFRKTLTNVQVNGIFLNPIVYESFKKGNRNYCMLRAMRMYRVLKL